MKFLLKRNEKSINRIFSKQTHKAQLYYLCIAYLLDVFKINTRRKNN